MTKNKSIRKERAEQRQAVSSKRSVKERIAALDELLGKDVGAVKERMRLNKLLLIESLKTETETEAKKKTNKANSK